MGTNFHHLTLVERDRILEMRCNGNSLCQIAGLLDRAPSTLSRELRRNASPAYRCYLPHRAQDRAEQRKGEASQRFRLKEERIRSYVEAKLHEGWSPEIIAGRIRLDHPGLAISYEAIYKYVYHPQTPNRKDLILCLRRAHRRRRPKGLSRKERKTKIPNRIGIEMRPASVDTRREFGHWEGDTLISRRSPACLASLVERKSRLLHLTWLPRKGAAETAQAMIQRLASLPPTARQTLTLDNGTENASHEAITQALGLSCFFCHPYTSWERGTVENIQGLIRWYLPKGTDFGIITDQQVAWIESQLNHRPRKCLGFKTPLEVASPSVAFQG